MTLKIYQVDAFTDRLFGGNPAAIIPLAHWLPNELLQSIALENNLSETAYFVKDGNAFHLRWFTPTLEVELCGHATLASAFVLYDVLGYEEDRIQFKTLSGPLYINRSGKEIVMDFPTAQMAEVPIPEDFVSALGQAPEALFEAPTKYMAIFKDEATILSIAPDFKALGRFQKNVIITAPGNQCDFVSRFFAPASGIDEDPVTGSAHTLLTPYWSKVLKKQTMQAQQVSVRGGQLICSYNGDRVSIAGQCRLYMTGECHIN